MIRQRRGRIRRREGQQRLREFIVELLMNPTKRDVVHFTLEGRAEREFLVADRIELARLWGMRRRNRLMEWNNVARSIRDAYGEWFLHHNENGNFRYILVLSEEVLGFMRQTVEQVDAYIQENAIDG